MTEKKFGDRTFKVEKILATKALLLQARILKMAGPAVKHIPTLFAAIREAQADQAQINLPGVGEPGMPRLTVGMLKTGSAAVESFMQIFADSNPADVAALIKDVVEIAEIQQDSGQYTGVDLDREFDGADPLIIEIAVFVLQEQFSDFFTALLASGSRALAGDGKALSADEAARIAPNINLFLWRPVLAPEPLCTYRDIREWVTITDLLDMHEALDLKAAMAERANAK